MARFNSAKMNLAAEVGGISAFERKYNALIDLLDQGYTVESLMNDHQVKVAINPQDGIKITTDSESVFSIDSLTGQIVIGKYDGLISDLVTDLGTAYNDIAQQLGYTDYDDMVAEAIAGNTIINGGWLRTSLIQANTILFDQLSSAAVTDITDTIDLGGRNLLKDSDKDVTNSNYALTVYTWANVSDMVHGEQYTITIEGTLPVGLSWYINVYAQNPTAYPALAYLSDSDKVSANKWVKTVTMPTLASGQTFTGVTSLYQFPLGSGQTVSVTRIKIEKGNKATDWTPAPEDKLSEGVSYAGVEIDATNGFVSTAIIGGNTIQTKANATEGFSIFKGADKMFGVDTDGRVFASSLSNVDIVGYHMTYGYGGSPGLECFHPVAGTPTKFLGISPSIGSDIYFFDKNGKNRVQVWVDGTFRITDHNQATRMYLYPDGGIEFKDINGYAVFAAAGGAATTVELACKANANMRIGVDSTGPYYVKNGTKTYF